MRPEKESMMNELRTSVDDSVFVILTDFGGMNMKQNAALRGTLREAAAQLALVEPERLDEALAMLEEGEPVAHGNPDERLRHLTMTAAVWRRAGNRDETVKAYEALFNEAERLRDLQRDDEARAGALAMVVHNYRILASYLLGHEEPPSHDDIDLAFRTLERMRSRVR